jgi:hypothetical protein
MSCSKLSDGYLTPRVTAWTYLHSHGHWRHKKPVSSSTIYVYVSNTDPLFYRLASAELAPDRQAPLASLAVNLGHVERFIAPMLSLPISSSALMKVARCRLTSPSVSAAPSLAVRTESSIITPFPGTSLTTFPTPTTPMKGTTKPLGVSLLLILAQVIPDSDHRNFAERSLKHPP